MCKEIGGTIGIAIGEASMCWSEVPKGVFESSKAKEITNNLKKDCAIYFKQEALREAKLEIQKVYRELKAHEKDTITFMYDINTAFDKMIIEAGKK